MSYLAKRNGQEWVSILVPVFLLLPKGQSESAEGGKGGRWIRFARLAPAAFVGLRLERYTGRHLVRQAFRFSGKPAAKVVKQRQLVTRIL